MNKQELVSALGKIYGWSAEKAERIIDLNVAAGNTEVLG
jgi:hypothetical protein